MAKQLINRGSNANDGTGDSLRDGADKLNDNFSEIYSVLGNGENLQQLKDFQESLSCIEYNDI